MAGTLRGCIGKNIKMFRKRAEMTQVDLAKKLGYTSSGTISQIENGSRGMDFDKLDLAAEVLNIDAAILLAPDTFDDQQIEDLQLFYSIQKKSKQGNRMAKIITGMIHDLLRKPTGSKRF
jgi:transcriptional regulator with XRE-family HTH domain